VGKGSPRPLVVAWWAVTVAWAILIFFFSTRPFGANYTQSLLTWVLGLLHLHVSLHAVRLLNEVIRKLSHIMEYGFLALLLYGPSDGRLENLWRPRRALFCVLAAAFYSLTDEFHQIFVPGRGASLIDCGLDTLGAGLAMLLPFGGHQICLRTSRPINPKD